MNHFLALSVNASDGASHRSAEILERSQRAFRKLNPQAQPLHLSFSEGEHVLLGCVELSRFHQPTPGSFCYLVSQPPWQGTDGRVMNAQRLFDGCAAAGDAAFRDLVPPFGGCLRTEQFKGIVAYADPCGLQQIYFWQGEGWTLASSSCLLAGYVARGTLDEEALGLYSALGYFLAGQSSFRNVRKLDPGHACSLQSGHCTVSSYLAGKGSNLSPITDWGEAVKTGAETLRRHTAASLEAFPECGIELSGGLDSRLILASIPKERRRSVFAFTIVQPHSPDSGPAAQIARAARMKHLVVDISRLRELAPDAAFALSKRASLACDHCSNPFTRAVLDWVNQQLEASPRFTGENGEFARGHFYAGQPDALSPTRRLMEDLVKWRVRTVQSIDTGILADRCRGELAERLTGVIQGMFGTYHRGWLESCDEFFLDGLMQRCAGAAWSKASQTRTILAPFFGASYIAWARRVPPSFKRGSRLVSGVLECLDPELAQLPLSTGFSPRDLLAPSLTVRLRQRLDFFRKLASKVRTRVAGPGRSNFGVEDMCRMVYPPGSSIAGLLPRACNLSFLDAKSLEEIEKGTRKLDWLTLGFLLNVEWTLEFLEDPSPL